MSTKLHCFGPDSCEGPTLAVHCAFVPMMAALPAALGWALSGGSLFGAAVGVAIVLVPRFMWQPGWKDGPLFTAALAIYWNVVLAASFTSPFVISIVASHAPWVVLPLLAIYIAWAQGTRFEMRDGMPWAWFSIREWGYHAFRHFVNFRLLIPDPLLKMKPEDPVIFGVHPHGVASDYRMLMDGMLYKALPGREVLVLAASILFKLPLVRELVLWTRCIDASRPVAERALRKGHSVMVIPGGEREQIRTCFQKEEVFLPSIGFVKLALQAGTPLVPCYVFGCVDLYRTYTFLHGPREWLRKQFRICIPLYTGSFGFLPRRVPLAAVFADPIPMTCAEPGKPTDDEVSQGLHTYVEALKKLFEENKAEFGAAGRELAVEYPEVRKKE